MWSMWAWVMKTARIGLTTQFCQVGDLAAVEQKGTPQGADAQKQQRVVQQAAKEGRLAVAEGKPPFSPWRGHSALPLEWHHPGAAGPAPALICKSA